MSFLTFCPFGPGEQVSTVLLDTSVLRSRAQLGKRRAPRSRPTRTAPPQGEGGATDDWRFRDSTGRLQSALHRPFPHSASKLTKRVTLKIKHLSFSFELNGGFSWTESV